MSTWAIVFLIIGAVILVISFMLPIRKETNMDATDALARREIEDLVSMEMDSIKTHVDEVVEEAIEYAMEKTERSLERLSNEKIMAVSEYSDTVLAEIHRNHEEVMFLYDMLNDKHQNLKNTVSEVNKTVKEAKEVTESQKEPEASDVFKTLVPDTVVVNPEPEVEEISLQEEEAVTDDDSNNNEAILALHKLGMPTVEIAQQLGLGVGEVKLVIDLYQGA